MRAYTWISLSCLALACGGTAFSTDENNNGGTNSEGASSGTLNRAGRNSGGSVGKGGTKSSGGTDAGGTDTGGTNAGGTDAGGTDIGGTDVGGTDTGGTTSGGASGGVTSGGTGTVGGNPNGGSGGVTSIDIVCPKNQPSVGKACKDGLVCSYGQDIRTSCRNVATCSNGVWGVEKPSCPALDACQGVQPGAMCDGNTAMPCQLDGQLKQYCVCTACAGGACMVDGATWQCSSVSGMNCPEVAPNEGQACTGERECDYGSCATGNPLAAVCSNAVWGWHYTIKCPL